VPEPAPGLAAGDQANRHPQCRNGSGSRRRGDHRSADGGESHAEMVAAAWDFGIVAQSYTKYLIHLEAVPQVHERLQEWWQDEHSLWQTCMEVDPLLPRELWPSSYAGEGAWHEKHRVMRAAAARVTQRPDKF